jgi:hypothetical protein
MLVSFYFLPTFIELIFFKFYIQLIKIQCKHVSFHNEFLFKNWTYFLMFMLKNYHN